MANATSAAGLSAIIGAIYDCALDPARWPATLALICDRLDFVNAVLALQPLPTGRPLLSASTGIAPPFLERLSDYGEDVIEQWGGQRAALTLSLDEPAVLSRVNPAACASGRNDRYYREWRHPQGLVDTLNVPLMREPDAIGMLSFGRHKNAGLVGEREIGLARLLLPHLQRAVAISRMLELKTLEAETLRTVLDSLSTPICLTGPRLELVHANCAARQLLDRAELIRATEGVLSTGSTQVTSALASKVQRTTSEAVIDGADFGPVTVSATSGETHAFYVMPLQQSSRDTGMLAAATVAIFIRQAACTPSVQGAVFAQTFGLTPAEARVVEQVAAGRTTSEAATALKVQPSTVKTHLLRIFQKTGARRQSELVALAAAITPPIIAR